MMILKVRSVLIILVISCIFSGCVKYRSREFLLPEAVEQTQNIHIYPKLIAFKGSSHASFDDTSSFDIILCIEPASNETDPRNIEIYFEVLLRF